jgi:carboxymethylenebutenolidase
MEWPASAPIVASYGGRDRSLRGTADKLDTVLTGAGVPHDIVEYPRAGHSFLNDRDNGPLLLRPLLKVMGVGPEPASAQDAWARIETYFDRYLR